MTSVMDQLEPPFTINPTVLIDPEAITVDRAWQPGSRWLVRDPDAVLFTSAGPRWQVALGLVEGR
jgi:hypothetical protein